MASRPENGGQAKAFRERALVEAGRYGPDRWVFVRELLQNARDAGASRVHFRVGVEDGFEEIYCRDDGEGMSFDHAKKFLFTLYASSKESQKELVGEFGVGFWSVLRFEPTQIVIRSAPKGGPAWQVVLEGDLSAAERGDCSLEGGTEILLRRPVRSGQLGRRVLDAVHQNGRYLRRLHKPKEPLTITVNGEGVNEAFGLPPPCTAFQKGAARGVVSLGGAPRVELFSKGLRVRSAACLEDLLADGTSSSRSRVSFASLPGGVAPVVILESDDLDLLLSRTDAVEDQALIRLVDLAERELDRLLDRQLSCLRPESWWTRAHKTLSRAWPKTSGRSGALGAALGSLAVLLAVGAVWGGVQLRREIPVVAPVARPVAMASVAYAPAPVTRPLVWTAYQDPATYYRGPTSETLADIRTQLDLTYFPGGQTLYFRALGVDDLSPRSLAAVGIGPNPYPDAGRPVGKYIGAECRQGCVSVALTIGLGDPVTRLPVPTGHRLVAASVTLDGKPVEPQRTSMGEPIIHARGTGAARVEYQTSPGHGGRFRQRWARSAGTLPLEVEAAAKAIEWGPSLQHRVEQIERLLENNVRYDVSEAVAARHRELAHLPVVERAFAVGAGDCDVQAAVLVEMMRVARVPARVAIGHVGKHGRVLPAAHAWVEYSAGRGTWRVSDPSQRAGGSGPTAVARDEVRRSTPTPPNEWTLAQTSEPRSLFAEALPWFGAGLLGLLLLPGAVGFARRTRRHTVLDAGQDVSALLRGVLQRPEAFAHVPSLFHRPLVQTLDGQVLSILEVRRLAACGHLYTTKERSTLAQVASRKGAAVLDVSHPEARVVADALGAVDLDRWDVRLKRSVSTPLLDSVCAFLRARGEQWIVRLVGGLPASPRTLDLPVGGVLPWDRKARRLVLLDPRTSWLADLENRFPEAPRECRFSALERVLGALDLPADQSAELLAAAAREAVMEVAR